MLLRRARDVGDGRARLAGDARARDLNVVETRGTGHHHAAKAAVAHEQVRAQAQDEVGRVVLAAGADDVDELGHRLRLDVEVGGATHLERGVGAHRLVGTDVLGAHELLEELPIDRVPLAIH